MNTTVSSLPSEVSTFLEQHQEVLEEKTTDAKCYETLVSIAIQTKDPAWSLLTTSAIRAWRESKRKVRTHTRHNWKKVEEKIHRYLVRLDGNVAATAREIYPNSKHAHQSLNVWIKKNYKSADHFVVQFEREKKEAVVAKPVAKAVGMTAKQISYYMKMLEALAGADTAEAFKKLAMEK